MILFQTLILSVIEYGIWILTFSAAQAEAKGTCLISDNDRATSISLSEGISEHLHRQEASRPRKDWPDTSIYA